MDFQSEKSFGKLRLRAFQPYHQILCMSKHVEDVEDRSNTHKGCNAMYVEDVEDGKKTYHTFWLITSLILNGFSIRKKFWKAETESFPTIPSNSMYVEDVKDRSNTHKGCNAMYVEDVEDGKRTYHTFWLITSLILNGFSIRKKFWKAETESFPTIPSNSMYVEACRRCRR